MSCDLYKEMKDRKKRIGVDRDIVKKIGWNAAIVLDRIIWSCGTKNKERDFDRYFIDGFWWMSESIKSISENCVLGEGQAKRAIKKITTMDLVQSRRMPKSTADKPKMYRPIDENIRKLLVGHNVKPVSCYDPTGTVKTILGKDQSDTIGKVKLTHCVSSKRPNPSYYSLESFLESDLESYESISDLKETCTLTHAPVKDDLNSIDFLKDRDHKTSIDIAEDPKNTPPVDEQGLNKGNIPKEIKSRKKALRKPRVIKEKYSLRAYELAGIWYNRSVQRVNSPQKCWNQEYFAEHLFKAQQKVRISDEVLSRVVEFCTKDYFWSKNCLSPRSLLKRNDDGVLRIDTILNRLISKSDLEMHNINNMRQLTPDEERQLNPFL